MPYYTMPYYAAVYRAQELARVGQGPQDEERQDAGDGVGRRHAGHGCPGRLAALPQINIEAYRGPCLEDSRRTIVLKGAPLYFHLHLEECKGLRYCWQL